MSLPLLRLEMLRISIYARCESTDLERARKIGDVIAVEGPVVVMRLGLVEELNG